MALIKSNCIKKDLVFAKIDAEIFKEIQEYCKWAQIDDLGIFIEESTRLVLKEKGKKSGKNRAMV